MMLKNLLLVAIGGALGSVSRYLIGVIINQNNFPYATLVVNMVGSFCIGLIMAYLLKQQENNFWRLLLTTGFCGGFTTFSTFTWETLQLLQQHKIFTAVIYAAISFIAGIAAVFTGYYIIK